jgi:hypothetical protein
MSPNNDSLIHKIIKNQTNHTIELLIENQNKYPIYNKEKEPNDNYIPIKNEESLTCILEEAMPSKYNYSKSNSV